MAFQEYTVVGSLRSFLGSPSSNRVDEKRRLEAQDLQTCVNIADLVAITAQNNKKRILAGKMKFWMKTLAIWNE